MRRRYLCRLASAALALALSVPVLQAQTSLRLDAPRQVTAGDLAQRPDRYYGARVSVTASVEDVYNRHLFTIDEDRLWTSSRELLVLNPRPIDRAMSDSEVVITGTLTRFTRAEIERRADDWRLNLDRDLLARFEQQPVLVADAIRTTAGVSLLAADPLLSQDWDDTLREPRLRRETMMPPVPVEPGELADHPERYLGRVVSLRQRVSDVYSRSMFRLRDDIVVIAPDLAAAVAGDRYVTVSGEVMRFNISDIERQVRGYRVDVLPRYTDDLENDVVIIATSVRREDGQELLARR